VEEARGELADIVREARVLMSRGRLCRPRKAAMYVAPAAVPLAQETVALAASVPPTPASGVPPATSPPPTPGPEPPAAWPAQTLALPGFEEFASTSPAPQRSIYVPLGPREDLPQELPALQEKVKDCRLCGLCSTRTQTVFADGSPTARLLFVGEAPGRDEDAQGLPFVGRAGQLLNKMIAAIDLKREEVYICNVLKCRPPDNRVPAPDEVERCRPYLEQQIALVKPSVVCALGLSAAQALLQTKASMTSMRGKTFAYRGVPLIPTYHPAALLRNPGLKREAWIDLQRVRDLLRERTAA
jgi:uracil-DNA glycosylase family 4